MKYIKTIIIYDILNSNEYKAYIKFINTTPITTMYIYSI